MRKKLKIEKNTADKYLNRLENANNVSDSIPRSAEDDGYTYSPREIYEIYEGCLPEVINNDDESEDDWDLFHRLSELI